MTERKLPFIKTTAFSLAVAASLALARASANNNSSELSPPQGELSPPLSSEFNREDCFQIKGAQYLSEEERTWYLTNCIPQRPSTPISTQFTQGFTATHYGESYNGGPLGCGTGVYSSDNETILAVGPSREGELYCGIAVRITNPENGASITAARQDSCPGCGPNTLDLSEAGLDKLCGHSDCSSVSGLNVEIVEQTNTQLPID